MISGRFTYSIPVHPISIISEDDLVMENGVITVHLNLISYLSFNESEQKKNTIAVYSKFDLIHGLVY